MEDEIKNALRDVTLAGSDETALELLDSIKMGKESIGLFFRMPKNASSPDKSWDIAVKTACERVTKMPPIISFQAPKKMIRPQIPGVKRVIAVASGKGGVGKSSVAFSMALAAKRNGLKVALLDSDVFGPSLPTLMGINERPLVNDRKKIVPVVKFGIKVMSIGFLVAENSAVIWRGLMVQQATNQLLLDVDWSNDGEGVDVLFIDLPPGTGDVQLTLAQKARVDGAIVVSTPHALALADVRRAIRMFEKVQVPVLGCVENMKSFVCPCCRERTKLFAKDAVGEFCANHKIDHLGDIPYDLEFSEACEAGEPFVLNYPEHEVSKIFDVVFARVWKKIDSNA